MTLFFYKKSIIPVLLAVLSFSQCRVEPLQKPDKKLSPSAADDELSLTYTTSLIVDPNRTPMKNMLGVNAYEWNFLENPASPSIRNVIYEDNMSLIKSFGAVRHYMNWNKLEDTQGNYTYNPTNNGSWYYDLIYTRCKQDGIMVLADMKNLPVWMMNTYPSDQRDDEDVPVFYGADRSVPASYVVQARTAFQFAARYGYNAQVNPALVKVDSRPRWTNDPPNEVKIGLGLIKYIECGNENDRWWKGDKATQTPEEYAANMSAFYDGHKGTLGPDAGVKTADPTMQVVMGGLATADVGYVKRMVEWCRVNRGYKANGAINLCFDVINYHLYSNDGSVLTHTRATTGVAPELSEAGSIADSFVQYANSSLRGAPVWVTETGYDVNQESYQHAPPIKDKSALLTQADWTLRSALMYLRHGVRNLFFYQLFDAFPNNGDQYSTSGLAEGIKRRPAADYIMQVNKLMGDYVYEATTRQQPLQDRFRSGKNQMIVLTIPDQVGREADCVLGFSKSTQAIIYTPKPGADEMDAKVVNINADHTLKVHVTETPVFVHPIPVD